MLTIKEGKKAEVLLVLYNNAKKIGMGSLNNTVIRRLEDMKELLLKGTYFDYLDGKVLKIDLTTNELDPWLYDRDNGVGLCETLLTKNDLLEK